MTRKMLATGVASAAVLIAGSLIPASAQAQSADSTAEIKAVTVVAPRVVRRQMDGRTLVEVTQKSAAVYHGDLDLSRTADVSRLEDRVIDAATKVCMELEEQLPFGQPDPKVCANRAREDAMVLVQEAIQNAEARVASRY